METVPYDFSGLHRPMSASEVRQRRRAILAGRSLWSVLELEHIAGLIAVGGLGLTIVLPAGFVAGVSAITSARLARTPGEGLAVVLLATLAPIAAVALVVFSMRALLIPPRWRAWVRMHRFAEENGIEFIREERGVKVTGRLVAIRGSIAPARLYGAFRDHARGITLGDYVLPAATARGWGDWRGIIEVLVEADGADGAGGRLSYGVIQRVLGGTEGDWSIEMEVTGDRVVAMRAVPFRTRNLTNLERVFRMAWAIHENVPTVRGVAP